MLTDLTERQSAESFMQLFSPAIARQGRQRFSRGAIGSVSLVRDGERQPVPIQSKPSRSDAKIKTDLILKDGSWNSSCSCHHDLCEHSYAALLALLNNGAKSKQTAVNGNGNGNPHRIEESFEQVVFRKLTRPITASELRFLEAVKVIYRRVRAGKVLYASDFYGVISVFWQLPDTRSLAEDRHCTPEEFLQKLAVYCAVNKYELPDFMYEVTDREALEAELLNRRRSELVAQWKRTFADLQPPQSNVTETAELAVCVARGAVKIYKRNSKGDFKGLSANAWQNLLERIADGTVELQPASQAIANVFGSGQEYFTSNYSLSEPVVRRQLSQLFRIPEARDHVLTGELVPFERAASPLEWRLSEINERDYKLQLCGPDGGSPRNFMTVLPGNPHLYLTDTTAYEGPYKPRDFDCGPHLIPAAALETAEGMRLLTSFNVALPERLRARTRHVRLQVRIKCFLKKLPYQDAEQCCVEFAACGDGAQRERYGYNRWEVHFQARGKNKEDVFFIFDRSALEVVPGLISQMSGLSWDNFANTWRVRVTRNFAEKFLEWYNAVRESCPFELDAELASLVRDPVKARVQLECQEAGVDWFDLRTAVNVDDTTLTPEEIKLLLNARGKAVRLEGKGWRRMEYELTEDDEHNLAKLGLSAHDFSAEPQRFHALQLADRAAEKMLAAAQYEQIRQRANEIKTRVTPPVPQTITATLRPYQLDGFYFLAYLTENNFGGILADDMGLGKTVQTLTWLEWLRPRKAAEKASLVICPKSVMENWRNEAGKFAPELRVQLWRGMDGTALGQAAAENDLLVLNYAQIRSLATEAASLEWHAVILDEGQYIKNPDSQTAQAARALRASYRLALSGTPIENRLLDLWSLMAFAMPGVLGNRADFKRRFDQQNDPFARRRLSSRVRPFLLRRTKQQVASDLPDRVEEDIICELEGTQKLLYRAEFKRAQQLLLKVQTQKELNEFRFNFLSSLLRLRQICCHPALIDDQHQKEESAKLNALVDLLEPLVEEGHKVLVFSQFVEMLQILRTRLEQENWPYYYLDGSSENRGDLVDRFQNHDGTAVFLISLKAGGFGLNLTAASYVVLYDPWWNPAVENQAIDRTHRIGQTQKVIAYRLLTKNSIEEKIRQLQKQKSALAENVLGDEAFASSLTVDDLKFLFQDDDSLGS